MFAEENFPRRNSEVIFNEPANPELVACKGQHGFSEGPAGARPRGQRGYEKSLQLQEWFFEVDDIVQIQSTQARMAETKIDSPCRKREIVLPPGEPFLLGCGLDHSVNQQRGCGIVKITRYAEDSHSKLPPCG